MIITKQQQPNELPSSAVLVAADAVTFYLGKLAWPVRLGPDYGRSPQVVLADGSGSVSIAILVGFVTGLAAFRRSRFALVILAIFVLALAPVLGLVPFSYQRFSTVADRYAYFAVLPRRVGLALIVHQTHSSTWRSGLSSRRWEAWQS